MATTTYPEQNVQPVPNQQSTGYQNSQSYSNDSASQQQPFEIRH